MALCLETGYTSLNKTSEELCGDRVECTVCGDYTTLVLADGLGSGVKANILSTLTSKILCTMVSNDVDIEDCVETILQSYPKLKGVISGNDNMAVGAAAAIKAAGKTLKIIGVDGSNDARDEILAGNMTATAMQPAAQIAEMAVRQADKYLKTGSTGASEKQLIDCVIITKDNAKKLENFSYAK